MPRSAPLSSFRVRPRFTQSVPTDRATTRERILHALAQHSPHLEVKAFPQFIGLHIPAHERRYWSPRLFLSLEPGGDGGTRIEGTYGPEIEVWSVFLYGYLITGLLGTFSGIYGAAQMLIESEPTALYVTGSMGVVAGVLYLLAQLGQKLGAWQTFELHQAYENAVRPANAGSGDSPGAPDEP